MTAKKNTAQNSLEYVIIIGGIIILAAATYFMLRGFTETTSAGAVDTIGVAGDKLRLELENLGRSETRFLAQEWGSLPCLSLLTLNNTGGPASSDITLYNLTDYGLDLDEIEFAYNDSGEIEALGQTVEGSNVSFTTPTLPSGTSDILVFHKNSSALDLDNLNYSSSEPNVSIEDGTSPVGSPDTTPPSIIILSEAHGSSGSVKDADIKVIVYDDESIITEVYYSIGSSPYFLADNLYYGYEGMTVEGHPEDLTYNSNTETIHIIVTVPSEDNYTIRVWAVDSHGNEKVESREVSITITGAGPTDTNPPVLSEPEPANNSLLTVSLLTINLTTNETAVCRYATSPGIPYADMSFFSQTGSTLHQLENIPLMGGVNYNYFFKCGDFQGNTNPADYLLNFSRSGTDNAPPAIIESEPANNSIVDVSFLTINLTSNENAVCRYSDAPGTDYSSMDGMDSSGYTLHRLNVTMVDGVNYKYYFRCNDSKGNVNDTDYVLNFTKSAGEGPDTEPPVVLGTQPANNSLAYGTPITINVTTNENAHCRFSNESGTDYDLMTDFNGTDSAYHNITNVSIDEGVNYAYNLKCNDTSGNVNPSDYLLNFTGGGTPPSVSDVAFSAPSPYQEGYLNFTALVSDASGISWCNLSINNSVSTIVNKLMSLIPGKADAAAGAFAEDLYTATVNCSDALGYADADSLGFEVGKADRFGDGSESHNISFSSSNSSLTLELPLDAVVVNASMNLTGYGKPIDSWFNNTGNYTTGYSPQHLFAGDFDNDGNLDVVVTTFNADNFSYFEGNGDGTFQSRVDYATGDGPWGIYAGDFDNNGNLDVVVVNFIVNSFSYFNGSGDGTFQSRVDYATGNTPWRLTAGDFNNDGNLDVVTANHGSDSFSYFEGLGNGSFEAKEDYEGGYSPWPILAADFNNDSNLDVITAGAGYPVTFYYMAGKGDGTFNSSVAYPTQDETYGLYAGDFNEDGKLDLALTNEDHGHFSYFEGNGDGTFQGALNYTTASKPYGIYGGDFNLDGHLDVVVTNFFSDSFSYFEGLGNGSFEAKVDYGAGDFPNGIFAGDFDNDGDLDVIATNDNPDSFTYFENNLVNISNTTNPGLDIGLDGDTEWSHTGQLLTGEVFSGESFVNELNSFLPDCSCPGCTVNGLNCTLALNFSSDTPGILRVSDLYIQYARTMEDKLPPYILSTDPANNSLVVNNLTYNITIETNEVAHCRFSNESGNSYTSMTDFNSTDSTLHRITNVSLTEWHNYTYYFKCNDTSRNVNPSDYLLNFTAGDMTPPVILSTQPANDTVLDVFWSGAGGCINITTDETAHCRYSQTSGTPYPSMSDFSVTDATFHQLCLVLDCYDNYFYFKCKDIYGNVNSSDYNFYVDVLCPA